MYYSPPTSIWEVGNQIQFDEPLEADDPRFVDTDSARGQSFNYKSLLRPLGIDHNTLQLKMRPRDKLYILFCGHRGCGKSTELRRLTAKLNKPDKFFVLFLDALKELDIHNLEYTDVLLALAQQLLAQLVAKNIAIDAIFISDWTTGFSSALNPMKPLKPLRPK